SISSYENGRTTGDRLPANPSDNCSCDIGITDPDRVTLASDTVHVRAYIDVIAVASRQVVASVSTYSRVQITAGNAGKCRDTQRGIAVAMVEFKCSNTGGRVFAADIVAREGAKTRSRVSAAGRVFFQR